MAAWTRVFRSSIGTNFCHDQHSQDILVLTAIARKLRASLWEFPASGFCLTNQAERGTLNSQDSWVVPVKLAHVGSPTYGPPGSAEFFRRRGHFLGTRPDMNVLAFFLII